MAHDYGSLRPYAAVTVSLACEHGLSQWLSWAKCLQAPAIAAMGDDEAVLRKAAAGFDLRTRLQAEMLSPVFLCALAEVHHCSQRYEEALATIGEALRIADHTEGRWMDAELGRLKGEVISAACGRNTANEGEQHFRRALDIARSQGSRMFELRAASSLSRYLAARRQPGFCASSPGAALRPVHRGLRYTASETIAGSAGGDRQPADG
jgi:predicted ATPase